MIYLIVSLVFGGIVATVEVWSPPATRVNPIVMGLFVTIFWPLLVIPVVIATRRKLSAGHCDDYIDDPKAPEALRKFLVFARGPSHGLLTAKPHPKLFADYEGQRVRVTMASRLGDVGISRDLEAATGYHDRVRVSQLKNFSEEP